MRPLRITNICSCQSSEKIRELNYRRVLSGTNQRLEHHRPRSILRADVGNMSGVRRPYVIASRSGVPVKGEKTPLVRSFSHRSRSSSGSHDDAQIFVVG